MLSTKWHLHLEIRYGFKIITEFVFLKIRRFAPPLGQNALLGEAKCQWLSQIKLIFARKY